ncbi:hypothetical protein [Halochromatium salexigens]|uniref:Uncharacterized protein n=1 Tax=Halochromatium salexigens TaxID=49447 RepID=A0AAJ0UGR5_HALSE|nr:hypothetical protein [Halochromatium salexigens]MBK5931013.1 hypothetical protein [Halochromatium salexigens]
MFNNRTRLHRIALLIALSSVLGSACASQPLGDRVDADRLTIERVTSSRYEFSRVRVESGAESIRVSGEVARVILQRGLIPGKVRISLFGANGELLEQTEVKPMRRNRQDRSAHFYARLAMPATVGNTLLIEHGGG